MTVRPPQASPRVAPFLIEKDVDVQPRDGAGSQSDMHYHADYNAGTNTVHAGGEHESHLLLPVIPAKAG